MFSIAFVVFSIFVSSGHCAYRPCPLDDYGCIGAVLASHSNCNPNVRGYMPKSYIVPQFNFTVPYYGLLSIDDDVVIRKMDQCYVSEFMHYHHPESFVLGISCPRGISVDLRRHELQYRYLKPSIVRNYQISFNHTYIGFSLDLSVENNFNACLCQTSTDVSGSTLRIKKIDAGSDNSPPLPGTETSKTYFKEKFFSCSQELAPFWINSMLCNYGCDDKEIFQ